MAEPHILDEPARAALFGEQARFAIGTDRARRFDPAIGPLGAVTGTDAAALDDVARIVWQTGAFGALGARRLPDVYGARREIDLAIVQMVHSGDAAAPASVQGEPIVRLGTQHADEMLALATLTAPGPFGPRTGEIGAFWGVIREDRLVAMAGQRMRPAGFVEISGVCVHPDARGAGLAERLSRHQLVAIAAEGRRAFLHAYADRPGPIRLYEKLGFARRGEQAFTLFVPA